MRIKLHSAIRKLLGYSRGLSDGELLKLWRQRTKDVCKPCWELKYCPYGPLVEDFPLPPPTLAETEKHNDYLRECLRTGRLGDGTKLDARRRRFLRPSAVRRLAIVATLSRESPRRSLDPDDLTASSPPAADGLIVADSFLRE